MTTALTITVTSTIKKSLASTSILAAFFACAATQAQTSDSRLIEILVERGVITEQDARELLAETEAPEPRYPGLEFEPTMPIEDIHHRIQANRFRVETADGTHRFGIRGRLMVDAARGTFDDNLGSVAREDTPLPNHATRIRRARLGALGVMHDDWEWQLEVDFRDNEVRFANAYVGYLFPNSRLAVGHFKEPISMESSTSSRRLTFLERAAPIDAYRPDREIGILYETLVPAWYLGLGVFGGEGVEASRDLDEGYAFAARGSMAPHLTENSFVHLGASWNYRKNAYDVDDNEWSEVRLRTRTGARPLDLRLIGRDDLVGVESFTRTGLEAAAGSGPFAVQAEYMRVDLDLDRGAVIDELGNNATDRSSLTQDGWYVQASYFLTGESHNYRAFSGDFGTHIPARSLNQGGTGSWELAARFATADSLQHTRVGRGQKLDHWTLGLNWYPNKDMVFKANLMQFTNERDGESADGTVFALRAQFEF